MNADLRRFAYALEPLLGQRRWRLESLQARLGLALRDREAARGSLEELQARYRVEGALAAKELAADPGLHGRLVAWLMRLRRSVAAAEEALRALEAERAEIAAECVAQQQKVELLEAHRAECVAEFVREEERRLAADADRDWLSRREWRSARARSRDGAAGPEEPR